VQLMAVRAQTVGLFWKEIKESEDRILKKV
jgi:hypothetical protein